MIFLLYAYYVVVYRTSVFIDSCLFFCLCFYFWFFINLFVSSVSLPDDDNFCWPFFLSLSLSLFSERT